MLRVNSMTRRAALAMSSSAALSRGIDHLSSALDLPPADPVLAPVDGSPAHQVDLPAEERYQFLFHLDVIEQAPVGGRSEGHEHVHIAVRPEVVPQDRPEQRQFRNLPALAEVGELLFRDLQPVGVEASVHRSPSSMSRLKRPSSDRIPGVAVSPLMSASSNGPSAPRRSSRNRRSTTGSRFSISRQRIRTRCPVLFLPLTAR